MENPYGTALNKGHRPYLARKMGYAWAQPKLEIPWDMEHSPCGRKGQTGHSNEWVLYSERELASCLLSKDCSRFHVEE